MSTYLDNFNKTDILIHVGIDTVKLGGEFFEYCVKEGEAVKAGDLLMKFNIDGIRDKGYKLTTPIIISGMEDKSRIKMLASKMTDIGQRLFEVK
ncbi:MAG: PTS glucose transporter subunit IIA [Clostridia bacterium]|nr:PTS glucose transporter subunit IIA [Clostridia bacterium]